MKSLKKVKNLLFISLFIFSIISSFLINNVSSRHVNDRHLSILAAQFVKGHTAIPGIDVPFGDVADFHSTYYLYFGPLGSLLLMPLSLFMEKNAPQIILGIFSMIAVFFSVFYISKSFNFKRDDSLWLALFFIFSTVLFGVSIINITAYQVQALGAAMLLISLSLYFSRKNPLLIGIFMGLAVMTRFTLILSMIFFFIEFVQKRLTLKKVFLITLPVIIALLILGAYNFRRFHSFTETGYKYNSTLNSYPLAYNLKFGFISPVHIPANIYSFLLMPPEPLLKKGGGFILDFPFLKLSPWGTAIWYTSPLFFLLLTKFKKGKYTISSAITALALAVPSFVYFGIGFSQFGYRYALDFLPFLLILLLPCLSPRLTRTALILITIGVIFNCLYMASLWDSYPHFGIIK